MAEAPQAAAEADPIAPAQSRGLFRSPSFLAVGLVAAAICSIRGSRQTLVPLYASVEFALGPSRIGLLFTGLGLVGLVLIGPAGFAAPGDLTRPAARRAMAALPPRHSRFPALVRTLSTDPLINLPLVV